MSEHDDIELIRSPVRLDFQITAGRTQSRFLKAIECGAILGERCPSCTKVLVPPRGICRACGVPITEEVPLSDAGILTTFCVINIPFEGQMLTPPYVAGSILLDGSDLPIFHLVGGIAPDEVRMGIRVKAVWASELQPTLASIRYFEPTGEPDAPFECYAEHL